MHLMFVSAPLFCIKKQTTHRTKKIFVVLNLNVSNFFQVNILCLFVFNKFIDHLRHFRRDFDVTELLLLFLLMMFLFLLFI